LAQKGADDQERIAWRCGGIKKGHKATLHSIRADLIYLEPLRGEVWMRESARFFIG